MSRQKRILIGGTAMFLIVGLGVAIAAWLVTGSGNGAAKAGSLQNINVTAGTASTALYPGSTGDLAFNVENTGTIDLVITKVIGNGAISSDKTGCDGSNVTFDDITTGLGNALPANDTTAVSLPDAVLMVQDAATECQGATFTIPVTVTAGTPTTP